MLPAVDAIPSIGTFSSLCCVFPGLCVSVVVVVELAVVLLFHFALDLHPCFHLHLLVTSDSLSQSFDKSPFVQLFTCLAATGASV